MSNDILELIGGIILLVMAGDILVRGAVNLALRLGIPAFVVGLTVVAFGTSAPELLVSVRAASDNAPGIALGNVVGSNIANVLLVLGLTAIMSTIHAGDERTQRSYLTMLGATLLFILMAFLGPIGTPHAAILLIALGLMLWDNYRTAQAHRSALADAAEAKGCETVEGADPALPVWRIAAYTILGLIGLPLGADLLVDGSVGIARTLGISETVIGLTVVAAGTSLPELATCLTAALRKQADVTMGNVIGSSIFNLLAIVGIAGLVAPLKVPSQMLHSDLWAMLAATFLLGFFVLGRHDITRKWGFLLTVIYIGFVVTLVT